MISNKEAHKNLHEIVDSVKHDPCKDCKHYKLGYSFADGFICDLSIRSVDMWKSGVCIHDEQLRDLRKKEYKKNNLIIKKNNMNTFYKTNTILLSSFTEKELNSEQYQSWFSDAEVTKYNSHGLFPYTKKKQESFLSSIENDERIVFAIYVLASECYLKEGRVEKNIYIGNISLQSINWVYRSAEIAWVIGEKEYWGKGIATEAGKLVLQHGFNRLNLHRIWSGTAATNKGMQRVFEKLKFKKEGIFIDGMFLNGEYVDIYNYAITDKEWRTSYGRETKK